MKKNTGHFVSTRHKPADKKEIKGSRGKSERKEHLEERKRNGMSTDTPK